ncbi:hypothetical protein CALCODRAFT_245389 [Calocera cornea HHB12733]|uniref:Uncharacterized protein n=1 Tax=Calocera cornea HHB12733 TaxID=1353952 RepID=A0A165JTV0_9BASI|nr:hypothetical protein CALCODRAFT_245389 [Calocera cornea HHB12733]
MHARGRSTKFLTCSFKSCTVASKQCLTKHPKNTASIPGNGGVNGVLGALVVTICIYRLSSFICIYASAANIQELVAMAARRVASALIHGSDLHGVVWRPNVSDKADVLPMINWSKDTATAVAVVENAQNPQGDIDAGFKATARRMGACADRWVGGYCCPIMRSPVY